MLRTMTVEIMITIRIMIIIICRRKERKRNTPVLCAVVIVIDQVGVGYVSSVTIHIIRIFPFDSCEIMSDSEDHQRNMLILTREKKIELFQDNQHEKYQLI